jgi:hypothetical protein
MSVSISSGFIKQTRFFFVAFYLFDVIFDSLVKSVFSIFYVFGFGFWS